METRPMMPGDIEKVKKFWKNNDESCLIKSIDHEDMYYIYYFIDDKLFYQSIRNGVISSRQTSYFVDINEFYNGDSTREVYNWRFQRRNIIIFFNDDYYMWNDDCKKYTRICSLQNEVNVPETNGASCTQEHYKQDGIQPLTYMQKTMTVEQFIGFLRGNVIKYISRYDKKGVPLKDLQKAKQYLHWLTLAMEGKEIDPERDSV